MPYDVVNADEARALAAGEPLSFLHVTRSEIDLPPETEPVRRPRSTRRRCSNFESLKREAPLVIDDEPSLYFYRLRMGAHEQTALAGCFSVDEYDRGLIKKHEKTRKDKEDDRTRHITELRAQTGRGVPDLPRRAGGGRRRRARRRRARRSTTSPPPTASRTRSGGSTGARPRTRSSTAFAALPALYIADGHHRAASAARARAALAPPAADRGRRRDSSPWRFPTRRCRSCPYNRVVAGPGRPDARRRFSRRSGRGCAVDARSAPLPTRPGEVGMFLAARWYR